MGSPHSQRNPLASNAPCSWPEQGVPSPTGSRPALPPRRPPQPHRAHRPAQRHTQRVEPPGNSARPWDPATSSWGPQVLGCRRISAPTPRSGAPCSPCAGAEQWGPGRRPSGACSPRTPTPHPRGAPRTQEGATIQSSCGWRRSWRNRMTPTRETPAPSCPQTASTISSPWSSRNGTHPDDHPQLALCIHTHSGVHTNTPGRARTLYPPPAPEEVRRCGLRSRRR